MPIFCEWAASSDEVLRRHVHARGGCHGPTPLFRSIPPAGARPAATAKELVVCRYREDLAWLDEVPAGFRVSVYDKSGEPHAVTRQAQVERLPNVGREAHSMLHHIVRHYGTLAEWTYFVQGDAPFHAPDIIDRLAVAYEDTCALTRAYSPTHPHESIKGQDRIERIGGFEVRYGNAALQIHGTERPWLNPASWPHVFACPCPAPLWFGYGAMYAVPRHRIVARPLAFWGWLLRESERSRWDADEHADPPLTPWQMEALWVYLFADPADYPHRDHLAESIELTRQMKACPHRSTEGCGCAGARCSKKGGEIVTHIDCFGCLRGEEG